MGCSMAKKNPLIGFSFERGLEDAGIRRDAIGLIAYQLASAMKNAKITNRWMAARRWTGKSR
jgi:hypothetical protein